MTRRDQASVDDPERGSTTIAIVFSVAVILLIVVQVVNVIVFQYGRGSVRAALDEGARVGSRAGVAACEQVARDAVQQLAGGLARGVTIRCDDTGTSIVATATVHFDGWLTSVADHDSVMIASAAKENG